MSGVPDPTHAREHARVGTTLSGKWRLDRVLGVGGMAAVYAASHRNGKRGAVKVLHPELSRDKDARERFLREGYVANRIEHPGVVQVLDDDVAEDGAVYLVMELLEGRTLDQVQEAQPGGCVAPEVAVELMGQLLDVLAAAHDKGVVHRDLKPENLFLDERGRVKVLDFGIVRLREPTSDKRTQTGSVMGTPAFMPPEQALGDWHRVDQRTDIWAVGATLFTMLTGRLVHEAETMNKLLLAAMTRQAPPLAAVLPGVHPRLAAIVDRALAFEPSQRFSSAGEMKLAFLSLRDAAPLTSPAPAIDVGPSAPSMRSVVSQHDATLAQSSLRGGHADGGQPTLRAVQVSGNETLQPSLRSPIEEPRFRLAPTLGGLVLAAGAAAAIFAWYRHASEAYVSPASAVVVAPSAVEDTAAPVASAPSPAAAPRASEAALAAPAPAAVSGSAAAGVAGPKATARGVRPVPSAPHGAPIDTALPTATAAPVPSSKGRDFDQRF